MLGPPMRMARGRGNPLLSAAELLSKNGYFQQSEKQWREKFNKKFGLDGQGIARKSLRDYWIQNIATKEKGLEAERKQLYGDIKTTSKKDFRDDEYTRIRFSNKMGFPNKHRYRDFEKWIAEHHTDSIALGACVEVNLSAKGIKGLSDVSKKLDKKGRATIVPGYDPFRLHQHKTFLKGGIASWMQGYMAGRLVETYKDKHHRWIAHTFNSNPNQYTVVFGYKVCSNTVDPTTSTITVREQMGLVRA